MKSIQDPPPLSPTEPRIELSATQPERHPLVLWLLANGRWIWPILVLAVVLAVSWSDLRTVHYRQVRDALHDQARSWLLLSFALTVANLALMGFYDVICLRTTKVPLRERWWVGMLAFGWSNFLTLGPLAGPAIRFWLYRPAGVGFSSLRSAIASIAVGFGAGLLIWLSVVMVPLPGNGLISWLIKTAAALLLGYIAGLLAHKVQLWKKFPSWVRELKVQWPILFALGCLDWLLACLVFEAVLRSNGFNLEPNLVLRLFFIGQGIGIVSLIPGGLGSADAFWLSRLNTLSHNGAAGLLVYRAVYYLLPWAAATILLLRRAVHDKVRWALPARLFVSVLVVISGAVVLLSAATPGLTFRMRLLRELLPVSVLEASHVATGIIGLLLLVLARGIMKGYRDAYRTAIFLLMAGSAGSMLKGLDYEEAIILAVTATLLWTHAPLFTLPSRTGGTAVAVLVPITLALFAFTAVGLSAYHDRLQGPLWTMLLHIGQAARFVRTLSVLLLLGLLIAIYFLLRIPHKYAPPTEEEIDRALSVHAQVGSGTNTLMVANRDKLIHFWQDQGLCLYRTSGRFMIVFSDPSTQPGTERAFMRSLLQRASELDRTLVFYQVSAQWIPVLHDYGYSFFKLGEEAIVDLDRFSIQGNKGKAMRNVLNRFRNDGYTFEFLQPDQVSAHIAEMKAVSQEWLKSKRTREKQFSIGFFDPVYLQRFPCALVRDKQGKAVAFANILPGPALQEFSVDLMRYLPECPNGVMDFLFLRIFEWGKEQGYRSFNLGMAPLATVGEVRQARTAERLANILFQHGEHWYNFRGLRQFKEKFDPRWVPRYLAYPAFWMWPQVIASVAALIAGGWRSVIFPRPAEDSAGVPSGE